MIVKLIKVVMNVTLKTVVLFQVGHVQKVSLVQGKVHEMKTLSLKPLLFGNYLYLLFLSLGVVNTDIRMIQNVMIMYVCVQKSLVSSLRESVRW